MKKLTFPGVIIIMLWILNGCGSGSGSGGTVAAVPLTQKTALVAFSVTSTSRLPFRINAIKMSAYIPDGITVPTVSNDPNQVSSTALFAGRAVKNALSSNYSILGNYSAPVRKVTVVLTDTTTSQIGFGPGEFALLLCDVEKNNTLTESDFTILNSNLFLGFNTQGFDPANGGSTVNLSSYLNPYLNVYFGY